MANNKPQISVIMAVYNGEKHLKQTIESILNQTFSNFEFLIVDDASTDTTPAILQQYVQKDSRLRIIANPVNLGLTKSLNKAISQARGKYIARMDDDDIALPERFQKQFEFMERNHQVALCGCLALVIDEAGREVGRKALALNHKDIKKKLLFNNQFMHSALFFRKVDKVGPCGLSARSDLVLYDESFERAQDYELVLRLAAKYPVANLLEPLIKWRFDEKSLSFADKKQQRCAIRARWWAITRYGYPKIKGLFHIILRIAWLLMPKQGFRS